jgi:hypothetical protein
VKKRRKREGKSKKESEREYTSEGGKREGDIRRGRNGRKIIGRKEYELRKRKKNR